MDAQSLERSIPLHHWYCRREGERERERERERRISELNLKDGSLLMFTRPNIYTCIHVHAHCIYIYAYMYIAVIWSCFLTFALVLM